MALAPHLAASTILFCISSWISNIHAAVAPASGESYFMYSTEDSHPVLDHGLFGSDFLKSTSPKVAEFYDPKCAACRAFKRSYVEAAKEVRDHNPHVEFYGISCEAHPDLCADYAVGPAAEVPRIFAFGPGPGSAPAAVRGIDAPEGGESAHLLSVRLMGALYALGEVAAGDGKLAAAAGPRGRRLFEDFGQDGEELGTSPLELPELRGEDALSEDSKDKDVGDDDEGDGDDDMDGDNDNEVDDDNASAGNDDASGKEHMTDGISEDKAEVISADDYKGMSRDEDSNASVEDSKRYEGSPSNRASSHKRVSRARHENVVFEDEENMTQAKQKRPPDQRFVMNEGSHHPQRVPREEYPRTHGHQDTLGQQGKKPSKPRDFYRDQNKSGGIGLPDERSDDKEGRQDSRGPSIHRGHQSSIPLDAYKRIDEFKRHRQTDAYKNTMKHFERKDIQEGKAVGYHYDKWKTERAKQMSNAADVQMRSVRGIAAQIEEGKDADARMNNARDIEAQILEGEDAGYHHKERDMQLSNTADARLRKARDIAAQKLADSRRPIREDSPDAVYAKNVFDQGAASDKESFLNNGQPHNNPLPIAGINYPNEKTGKRRVPPPSPNAGHQPLGGDNEEKTEKRLIPPPPLRDNMPADGGNEEKIEKRFIPPPPPRDNIPIGGGISVPNPLNTDPVQAKKFQEYIIRRKEMLDIKGKMKHPIGTRLGSGAPKKGENFSSIHRKKAPLDIYKKQFSLYNQARQTKMPDLRPEAQHETVGKKLLKNIPIVKRAFKRSKGEETMNDAALSFTRGLLMGVFKTNAALDYKKKAALLDWFDLLRVSLPPEIGLHELIDKLKYSIDSISERRENLLMIINEHPLPDHSWSKDCTKRSRGGYFCGFWKLLHIMSVGFAEQAGGLSLRESSPSIRVFSANEAGGVVREYMALFFNCDKCSKRFVAQYDDCSFQRCHRLSDKTYDAPAASWQEFPLWLWQVHNDVNRFKANQEVDVHVKAGRKEEEKKWERHMHAVYPRIDHCITCVTSSGTWDLDAVYNYLENEYWTFGQEVDPKIERFLGYNDIGRNTVSHGLKSYVIISVGLILAYMAKKHRIRVTGWHKKDDSSSLERLANHHRNS